MIDRILAELELDSRLGALRLAALFLACVPLLAAQLALGVPALAARARHWVEAAPRVRTRLALAVSACFVAAGLAAGRFDPYATAIFACGALAALGALAQVGRGTPGLTWTDAAVWLVLWIPFDRRWNYEMWPGPKGLSYSWWAVGIVVLAVIGWDLVRGLPGLGYRLFPGVRDLGIALAVLLAFAAIAIPVGLGIGFLHYPPAARPAVLDVVINFVGLFLTVAIPEELFFRGILQNGLERAWRRPGLALAAASAAFGLMHWNNVGDLRSQVAYCSLATVAGFFYGWAFRRSGALAAPVLVHTVTDAVWHFVLR